MVAPWKRFDCRNESNLYFQLLMSKVAAMAFSGNQVFCLQVTAQTAPRKLLRIFNSITKRSLTARNCCPGQCT
eukprot:10656418-Karenia_brevis.AAC.1